MISLGSVGVEDANSQRDVETQLTYGQHAESFPHITYLTGKQHDSDRERGRAKCIDRLVFVQHMGYFVVIQQLECVGNPKYIRQAECSVVPPRNRSTNAALTLVQEITSLTGTLKVSIPKRNKMHKIFEVSFELCKLLREQKRKTLIELLSTMTCLGNRTIQCPIHTVSGRAHIYYGGHLLNRFLFLLKGYYSARNVTIVESLPPVLSESDFLIRLNWFLPRVASVMNITAMGRLYEISKERARKKKYL